MCEVQTHPNDNNKLVAHIVWENDIKNLLKKNPEKVYDYLLEVQDVVMKKMGFKEAVPVSFCIRDSFPSAYSGKRDIKFIKNDVDGIIELELSKQKIKVK